MDATPFALCPEVEINYQQLVGLNLGPGLRKQVYARLGSHERCTHVTELIWVLATVAFQTVHASMNRRNQDFPEYAPKDGSAHTQDSLDASVKTAQGSSNTLIDSCYALRRDSPIIKRVWSDE